MSKIVKRLVTDTQEVAKATGRVFKAYDVVIIVVLALAALFVLLAKPHEQAIGLVLIAIFVIPFVLYKLFCRFSKGKPSGGDYKNGWR